MVHLRGNRPVCHYPISSLAGWMARVSLTSASCRLSLCLGDRSRRQPARRRRLRISYRLHLDIGYLLFLLGYSRVYSALRPRHFSSLYRPRAHWRSQSRFSSRLRRRLKHAGCPFHGDAFPVELGCLARTLARNFLDLRSGREPPKHCTL
jgi:hypothetical protein